MFAPRKTCKRKVYLLGGSKKSVLCACLDSRINQAFFILTVTSSKELKQGIIKKIIGLK